jgi:penicillin-binding protein 1A
VDEPIQIGDWSPQNFDRTYQGPLTLNDALRASVNTVAAGLGQEIGEARVIALARRFGISSELQALPSIALGSQEVTLWELSRAYGPFMTAGNRVDPYLIERITTSRGEVLFERVAHDPARVYPADTAKLMAAMLAGVITRGTGRAAAVDGLALAGKTGTSQSFRDAWFIGFSANTLGGVWTGNDDDTPMSGVTGGGLPARLFADIMALAHQDRPPGPLPGTGRLLNLTAEQERRLAFYRRLSADFERVGSPSAAP